MLGRVLLLDGTLELEDEEMLLLEASLVWDVVYAVDEIDELCDDGRVMTGQEVLLVRISVRVVVAVEVFDYKTRSILP